MAWSEGVYLCPAWRDSTWQSHMSLPLLLYQQGMCGPDCSAPLSHLEFLGVFPFNLPVGSDIARCSHFRHCDEAPCHDIIAHFVACPWFCPSFPCLAWTQSRVHAGQCPTAGLCPACGSTHVCFLQCRDWLQTPECWASTLPLSHSLPRPQHTHWLRDCDC